MKSVLNKSINAKLHLPLLLALSLVSINCSRGDAESSVKSEDASAGGVSAMSPSQKTLFFAGMSNVAYCEESQGCNVGESMRSEMEKLNLGNPLKGWKKSFISARDAGKDVEGYVFSSKGSQDVVISFRGTELDFSQGAWQDIISTDLNMAQKHYDGPVISGGAHMGFLEAMWGIYHPNEGGLDYVIQNHALQGKRFHLTGHSLGGAIAVLTAAHLVNNGLEVGSVYTYGNPKLAAWDLQDTYNKSLGDKTFQYINMDDPIPHMPEMFHGVGQNIKIDNSGNQDLLPKDGVDGWNIFSVLMGGGGGLVFHDLANDYEGYYGSLKSIFSVEVPAEESAESSEAEGSQEEASETTEEGSEEAA